MPKSGKHFKRYPTLGIEEWHRANGLLYDGDEPEEEEQKTGKKT